MDDRGDALNRALELYAAGLSVVPIAAGEKRPSIPWKTYQQRHCTFAELLAWFHNGGHSLNIGIVTGRLSGVVVVDVDSPDATAIADDLLPPTPWWVATARGEHRYYRHPDVPVPNRASIRVDAQRVALDLRGDGGLVVAPYSVHATGTIYRPSPLFGVVSVDRLPKFDVGLLPTHRDASSPSPAGFRAPADVEVLAQVRSYLETTPVPEIANGSDHAVFVVACRLVRGFGLCEDQAVEVLWNWCGDRPGWDKDWVRRKVQNAGAYGVEPVRARVRERMEAVRPGRFNPQSAATLLSTTEQGVDWVWDKFLPRGCLTLLSAFMKVGKTTFAFALALAVAKGDDFLGYSTQPGGVLILAVEEHERDIKTRLKKFGMTDDDHIHVHVGHFIQDPENHQAMIHFIREHDITMVLIDTMASFWAVENENDNAEVHRAVTRLLTTARETDAAVVAVVHESKAGGAAGRGIRGASALLGLADQTIQFDHRQGGRPTQRVLKTLGRYAESPKELLVELNGHEWSVVGAASNQGGNADWARIQELLDSGDGATVDQITEGTGIGARMVRKALDAHENDLSTTGAGHRGDPRIYRLRKDSQSGLVPPPKGGVGQENKSAVSNSIPDQPEAEGEKQSPID